MAKSLAALAALFLVAACSIGKDVPQAEKGVAQFHAMLNAERFKDIVSASGPEIQGDPKFEKLLQVVNKKLGHKVTSTQVGWNDNSTTGGHFITLNYETTYQNGIAAESFVFRIRDGQASMVGYHVNSDALIFN